MIKCFDASGNILFNGVTCDGLYDAGVTSTSSSSDVNISQSLSLTSVYGALTPVSEISIEQDITNREVVINVAGSLSADASLYKPPAKQFTLAVGNYNNYADDLNLTPATVACHAFGVSTAPVVSETYGLKSFGVNSTVNIDPTTKQYKLHPDSSGNKVRTATAVNWPVNKYFPTSDSTLISDSDVAQNITFDMAYDNPPLIFVVDIRFNETMGTNDFRTVSLLRMMKNASGKYVGAKVICMGKYGSDSGWELSGSAGTFTLSGNQLSATMDFDYVIVSDEDPTYDLPSISTDYGLKVFDSSGTTVFDSTYVTPNISLNDIVDRPYSFVTTQSDGTGFVVGTTNELLMDEAVPDDETTGVLLNNMLGLAGLFWNARTINVGGDDSAGGWVAVFGRMIFKYTPAQIQSIFSQTVSDDTLAISTGITSFANVRRYDGGWDSASYSTEGIYAIKGSWDFHHGNNTIPTLYCKFKDM